MMADPQGRAARPWLGLPVRLALITAVLAVVLVVGATEIALRLAERNRLNDLERESVDLAGTLAAYLTRIAPTGETSAMAVGLGGWSRRHIIQTTAIVYLRSGVELVAGAASDSTTSRAPTTVDSLALAKQLPVSRFITEPAPAWQVAVPLGAGRPYGVLDVRVLTGRLDEWAREERRRGYLLAGVSALLLSAMVGLLTSRWVGQPLGSLTVAMASAHGGAGDAPAAREVGPPEFRDLIRHYNQLREALAAREREIESRSALQGLEERARAYERLAQAEEIASAFAHEIGTPLNTMNGHLQLLREDLRREPSRERVALLLAQVDRVTRIVRARLSRGDWPAPERRATNLDRLAATVLRFLQPVADMARVSVRSEGPTGVPVTADTDSSLVEQVLLNLMKNAIEALRPGGHLVLRTGRDDGRAYIEVEDDGPGLPEDVRAHLFQPFVTTKGVGGTGLGLAVSRRLAQTLGGELVYLPSERGTRWRLTLPLETSP
jgi:signal transduction histidine kinase